MSRLPFLQDHFPTQRPQRLSDQHFGLALTPKDLLSFVAGPMFNADYVRPWRHMEATAKDTGSVITSDSKKFQVDLDVQHFAPEDISVKTVDGFLIIEGKHEEKEDPHGYISRQFVRRYALPNGVLLEAIESKLSSDGVLTVSAPKNIPEPIKGERQVPIVPTGPVRINVQ